MVALKKFIIIGLVIFLLLSQIITSVINLPEESKTAIESEDGYFKSQKDTKNLLDKLLDLFKSEQPQEKEDDRIWHYSN